jgi:transcriptional regulator of acetoin/glycerol metabolism
MTAAVAESRLRMEALAYLYDKLRDLPSWLQHLTPVQMQQLAALISAWDAKRHDPVAVHPLDEVERREFTRALIVFNGDVCSAARALGVGKTTFYRKMKSWGFSPSDWRLIYQAAALASPGSYSEHSECR